MSERRTRRNAKTRNGTIAHCFVFDRLIEIRLLPQTKARQMPFLTSNSSAPVRLQTSKKPTLQQQRIQVEMSTPKQLCRNKSDDARQQQPPLSNQQSPQQFPSL
jgi:hypothetical protein